MASGQLEESGPSYGKFTSCVLLCEILLSKKSN